MSILSTIHQIATAIAKATEKPKPTIRLEQIPAGYLAGELTNLGIQIEVTVRDVVYFNTFSEDWAKVFDYVYFDFPMPSYIVERMDCDDFAILMKELCSALFGLNTCGAVMGNMPLGYHQWNLFRCEDKWMQLEPQTGEIFPIGEKGYKPDWILI